METKSNLHEGWKNNLQLANQRAEVVVSVDAGPRILSYRTQGGTNVLKRVPDPGEHQEQTKWAVRGGHRLWIAPEDETSTAVPDLLPVSHELHPPHSVRLVNTALDSWKLRKELVVTLDAESTKVTLLHRATNEGEASVEVATWGLTVMVPGGLEIIPLPPMGEYPHDLLPNRLMVLWPYTDMSDPRFRFGWRFITIRQAGESGPLKLGLAHTENWVAYLTKDALFVKSFVFAEGEKYPDHGCNFATFTNADMLEIETLSPLRKLAPGQSVEHAETWHLFGGIGMPHSLKERELAEWIEPYLVEAGVL